MNEQVEIEQQEQAEAVHPLLTKEYLQNPYAFFRRLFEQTPLFWWEQENTWVVTGYEETEALLKDPRVIRDYSRIAPAEEQEEIPDAIKPLMQMQGNWMLLKDGLDHARLRGLVNKAFTPTMVERMRPHIQEIATELLDSLQERERIDLIAEFAYPLPVIVIAELLGVSAEDRHLFHDWSQLIVKTLDATVAPEEFARGAQATLEIMAYLRGLVAARRKAPQNDLISDLIQAEEQGEKLSEDELLATCALLLIAGHETTVNLIGNCIYTLLQHPDQLAKLRAVPELVPLAVEEILRYESPVQMVSRYVGEDLEFHGVQLKKGQVINFALAAANRDPRKFEDPDQFTITRTPNRHLAFASGPHFCVGASLARAEAQIALQTFFARVQDIEPLTTEVEWAKNAVFRGLTSFPIRVTME